MRNKLSYLSVWNLPVYLVLMSLVIFSTRDFEQAQRAFVDVGNIHKVAGLLLAFLLLITQFLTKSVIPNNISAPQKAYFFYIISAFISCYFSEVFIFSMWKLFEILVVFMVSLYVFSYACKNLLYAKHFYETILMFFKVIIVFALIGAMLFPSDALVSPITEQAIAAYGQAYLPYQLYGTIILVNANSLGLIAAILLIVKFIRYLYGERSVTNTSWLIIAVLVFIFCQSRTALIGLLLSFLTVILFSKRQSALVKIVLLISASGLIYFLVDYIILYATRGYSFDRLSTMSGRTIWWEYVIDAFFKASLPEQFFGMGYMAANRLILTEMGHAGASTLHSDYMDALISVGYLGVTLMTLSIIGLLLASWKAVRSSKNVLSIEMLGITILLTIRSFTGTVVSSHNFFLILFFSVSILSYFLSKVRN